MHQALQGWIGFHFRWWPYESIVNVCRKAWTSVLVLVTEAALLKGRAFSPVLKKACLPSLKFMGNVTDALLAWRASRADIVIAVRRPAVQIIRSEE